ncbi:cation diffusion facilitator family transporter [soil metagenome]
MTPRFAATTTRIAATSIGVSVAVLLLKFWAFALTGSVALWSDALESLVNIATAVAALAAIRYGALPPDANHPYGHHKAEYFSVVLEGVLIVIAAVSIFSAAWAALSVPKAIDQPILGLAVNAVAAVVNAGWGLVLLREGRRRRSPALHADGIHLFTDVATSAGVILGLVLSLVTGWLILDPLLAAFVALNILWSGWKLIRLSIGGLMDEAVAPETLDRIRTIISENATGAIEAHDVRTRNAGRMTFIEFHLVVPGTMPVSQSHEICDRIERALRAEVSDALITIHVEPEEKAKHTGVVVV